MTSPQPLSKAELASQQFNVLWQRLVADPANMPTEFELKRIEKSAREGQKVDRGLALSVLGRLSILKNDPEEMCYYHEQAIQAMPNNGLVYINYGIGLLAFGNFRQARELLRQTVHHEVGNIRILRIMLSCCLAAGRFQEAQQWHERIKQLHPDSKHLETMLYPDSKHPETTLQEIVSLVKKHNMSDDDVNTCQDHVSSLLWEHKVPVLGVVPEMFYEGNESWIGLRYNLLCSVEQAVELEWELSDRLPGGPEAMQESSPYRWVVTDFLGGWVENGY